MATPGATSAWMRPGAGRWACGTHNPRAEEPAPVPLGCVSIVVPWNYPIYLTIGPSPPPADSHFFNHLFCEDFCSSLEFYL